MTRPRDIADGINRIDTSAADATAITIDANENVGIGGTPASGRKVHVQGTGFTEVLVERTDATTSAMILGADSGVGSLVSRVSESDNTAVPMRFLTGSNERMRIDSSGNVGIGTSSPAELLNLAAGSPVLRFTATGDSNYHHLFSVSDDFYISADRNNTGSGNLIFRNGGTSERMRIDSSGNVIVGASSFNSDLASVAQFEASDSTAGGIVINTATAGANNYGRLLFTVANSAGNEGLIRYNTNDYHMSFWTNAAERLRIDSTGRLLTTTSLTSSTSYTLQLQTQAPTNTRVRHINFVNGNQGRGYIRSGNTDSDLPSFVAGSDYRFKTNITDYTGGYDKIKNIPVKQFDETTTGATGQIGWIAHEVAEHFPNAVEGEKDAVDDDGNPIYQGLAPLAFYPDVVQALQQAITKIETLEAKVTALENA